MGPADGFDGGDGGGGVFQLVIAQQRQVQVIGTQQSVNGQRLAGALGLRLRRGRGLGFPSDVAPDQGRLHAQAVAHVKDRSQGFGALRRDYRDRAGLDDAGFFGGDFADGIPQDLGVIHAYRGYDAYIGVYHISGVQPPAEAHFHGLNVGAGLVIAVERHSGKKLEHRHRLPGRIRARRGFAAGGTAGPEIRYQPGEMFLRNGLAVQPHSFPESVQMGRGIETGL